MVLHVFVQNNISIAIAKDPHQQTAIIAKRIDTENTQPTKLSSFLASEKSSDNKEIVSLSFSWINPTNLAAFERNGKLWLIFDQLQQIDIQSLKKTAGNLVENIISFPHPLATLIQITPSKGVKTSVRKEGLLWVVDLSVSKLPSFDFQEMTIFTQYDSLKQPYLFIPSEIAGNIISIIDPEIGDIISVTPVSEPHHGISQQYKYPEFEILNTHQGNAFVINAPDIMLSRSNSGITLRAQGRGLNITSNLDSLKYSQQNKGKKSAQAFNIQLPQKIQKMNFIDAVEQYKKDIIAAPVENKNHLRVELARYYVHHGLGTNALFILNQIKKAKLPEAKTDDFYALSGIANFLTHRYQEAVSDFEQGSIPESDEGIFWRTLSQSAYEFSEPNNAILFAHISVIKDYPQEIKDRIALVATANALRTNDDLAAQNFIDILRSVPDRVRNLTSQINYLAAKKLELQGYPRNAIKEYRNIINDASTKFSSLARYDNAVLSQRIGVMPIKKAISELERLRFAWGEQEFKLKLLNKLSDLYLKDFDFYNALRTLNEAGNFIKEESKKKAIANRMIHVFEEIFLNNQADDKISPIKTLVLYQDFEWLANMSPKKNAIIQRLADRLVAIDLLYRASSLLTTLLETDITPDTRARIGSRLAIINLFEERPNHAIEILNNTDAPNLLPETSNPRRIIKARALSQIGRIDEALELLKDDYSKTALLNKFEIYWKGGIWDKAADTIKHLIEEPQAGKPLSTEQINFVLDWATTLKKAGRETVLVRVRNKFMPYFANTKYHSIFNILTKQLEKNKIDIKDINNIVNDVQTFTNYAKAYSESLQHSNLEE